MSTLIATLAIHGLFTVEARVLDAVEGGPLILEATATYSGRRPLRVWADPAASPFEVDLPPEWAVFHRPQARPLFTSGPGFEMIEPGHTTVVRIPVHKLVCGDIPAGPAVLRVKYLLSTAPEGARPHTIAVGRRVSVEVGRCTDQFVEATHAEIARVVATRSRRLGHEYETELAVQADWVLGTCHPALVPLGCDLLHATGSQPTRRALRDYLRASPTGTKHLHEWDTHTVLTSNDPVALGEMFTDWSNSERPYLARASRALFFFFAIPADPLQTCADGHAVVPTRMIDFLRMWPRPSHRLPDEHLARLLGAKPLWLRAFIGATFGPRLPEAWTARLDADLRKRVATVPEKLIDEWIGQLDDAAFATREAATAQLLAHFDRVRPYLIRAASATDSPEVTLRLADILKRGASPGREPLKREFLSWLCKWESTPAPCLRAARVLGAGDPGSDIVREAKALLARAR